MAVCRINNGHLTIGGKRVRGFGVNCPDLFLRWLVNGCSSGDPVTYTATYAQVMDDLAARGLRFVRFLVTGFRTKTYRVGYKENSATFFARLDALVQAAENKGILLVPSIFFSAPAMAPLFSEPLRAYGDSGSLTYAEVNSAVTAIVSRYAGSSAIAYWEFANESDALTTNPPTVPGYSSDTNMEQPAAWTTADGWDHFTAGIATANFHAACKASDPSGVTASGHQGWRYLTSQKNGIDAIIKTIENDDKTDTVTLHPYESQGFHTQGYDGMASYLRQLQSHFTGRGKPLIIGEFGCSFSHAYGGRVGVGMYQHILNNIMAADVDLSMSWAYSAHMDVGADWYCNMNNQDAFAFLSALTSAAEKYNL